MAKDSIGLIELTSIAAGFQTCDAMLKAADVDLVLSRSICSGKYMVMVRGDVAAVQAAVSAGRHCVERLQGKLIMADVITHPHPELAALLPK